MSSFVAFFSILWLISCSKSNSEDSSSKDIAHDSKTLEDSESTIQESQPIVAEIGSVDGLLTDATSQLPLSGILVEGGGIQGYTDNLGFFHLAEVPVGTVVISSRTPGRSTAWAKTEVVKGGRSLVWLTSTILETTSLNDAKAGGKVTGSHGFSIDFPPDALQDSTGNSVQGQVDVGYVVLNNVGKIAAAPSLIAENTSGEAFLLESFGMVEVQLTQNGNPLQLAQAATLSIPIFGDPVAAGAGLYAYDEASGVWKEEGVGTVVGGVYQAEVEHFSSWNCDAPLEETSCLMGHVTDKGGNPLSGAVIKFQGQDYGFSTTTTTDETGAFCIDGKMGSTNTVDGYYLENGRYYTIAETSITLGSSPTNCSLGSCSEKDLKATLSANTCVSGNLVDNAEQGACWTVSDENDQLVASGRVYPASPEDTSFSMDIPVGKKIVFSPGQESIELENRDTVVALGNCQEMGDIQGGIVGETNECLIEGDADTGAARIGIPNVVLDIDLDSDIDRGF